jgi:hypothetical protein
MFPDDGPTTSTFAPEKLAGKMTGSFAALR